MKYIVVSLVVMLCAPTDVNSQNRTYLGVEAGIGNDIFKVTDSNDYLKTIPLPSGQWGLNLRHEITRRFFVESGVIIRYYSEGFGFKTVPSGGSSSDEGTFLIPIRFGLNINLYKDKILFVPVIGYTIGISPPYGYGLGYGKSESSTTVIHYSFTETPNSSRYFSLLQGGVGLEFLLFKTVLFSVSTSYYFGFNTITRLDINYTVNNSSVMTGTATSKGEFFYVGAGLKYSISNFWTKE